MRRTMPLIALVALCLLPTISRAAVPEGVDKAIDRGVDYLRALQRDDGTWPYGEIGATALAGLTLLECGVPANDPAITSAADAVRRASINVTHTYSISLSLLFLDRLGEPVDVAIIESLTVRLLAGQNANGGWHYQCPNISESEVTRLTGLLKQRNELVAGKELPKPVPAGKRTARDLPKEIQDQLKLVNQQIANGKAVRNGNDDNSNTQFATLALWVARRHGLPTENAIAGLNGRFRSSQNADGGWGYKFNAASPGKRPTGKSTATMTCAGLLGLAVGYGVANETALKTDPKNKEPVKGGQPLLDPAKDLSVRAALIALSTIIDNPVGNNKGKPVPAVDNRGRMYYFLWSLERVAVAFGLQTIGNKDWYGWGAEILVANQGQDGSWQGAFGGAGADTCFALLFLRRANLARDLTANLNGAVQDPGDTVLKAGGVGGDDLMAALAGKTKLDLSSDDAVAEVSRPPAEEKPTTKPKPTTTPSTTPTPKPPPPDAEPDVVRLSDELLKAPSSKQSALIEKMRDAKGVVYTQALVRGISGLSGAMRDQAREALADRFARMTANTLKDKLQDEDAEVRRAGVLAVALKEETSLVPRLIEMLRDADPAVSRASLAALKTLTEQDFGSDQAAWKAWAAKRLK